MFSDGGLHLSFKGTPYIFANIERTTNFTRYLIKLSCVNTDSEHVAIDSEPVNTDSLVVPIDSHPVNPDFEHVAIEYRF